MSLLMAFSGQKRLENANAEVDGVLLPNKVLRRDSKPCRPMKKKDLKIKVRESGRPRRRGDGEDQPPPLRVYFYIKVMQSQEQHVPNLFPRRTLHSGFCEWLDTLTLDDAPQVHVLAHNFQGNESFFGCPWLLFPKLLVSGN